MSDAITAYPLSWPTGWKRTEHKNRAYGRFTTANSNGYRWSQDFSMSEANKRVISALKKLGANQKLTVISTNVAVRLDGLPRANQKRPEDPGAAVYWTDRNGATRCMAIDRYTRVEQNVAAIAATLEAMRTIERHGGAEILDRAFTGFAALPAPNAHKPWRQVLGEHTTLKSAKDMYRALASQAHPDKGGNASQMAEINQAWEDAKQELK